MNVNHYKSWSGLKKTLEEHLCAGLRGRISYFLTAYHEVHNAYRRASVRLDGKEIASFSWADTVKQEADLLSAWNETRVWDTNAPELKEKWNADGTFSDMDFLQAASDFLQMQILDALESDNLLIRMFAISDARVGKRKLAKMEADGTYLSYPAWLLRFYTLRFEVEKSKS